MFVNYFFIYFVVFSNSFIISDNRRSVNIFLLFSKRRRRDLNPRAAINDLLPFQGSPFNLLGTSPNSLNQIWYSVIDWKQSSGEDGIRTHVPFRTNGFQDRLVMTASIPLHVLRFYPCNGDNITTNQNKCQPLFKTFFNYSAEHHFSGNPEFQAGLKLRITAEMVKRNWKVSNISNQTEFP